MSELAQVAPGITPGPPALALRHLGKTYPGQVALADVSFEVLAGEVHALIGENGCGKSTLIKCLSGYHASDAGSEIDVTGERLPHPHTPRQARDHGVAFVHQNLGLIPTLSVMENLALGRGFTVGVGQRIKWRAEQRQTQTLLDDLEVGVRPTSLVADLSQADRTLVAIARGLRDAGENGKVLVLDEPSAALPEAEVSRLFAFVRRLQTRGLGIIYVSHRLQEIFELAQRVTVLRDSRTVGTFVVADLTERALVTHIIGKPLEEYLPRPQGTASTQTLVRADALTGNRVRDASFDIKRGEIVGVAGLLGSGRSELGRLLSGAQRPNSGHLSLNGQPVDWQRPRDAIRDRVALVPEDRRRDGAVLTMGVGPNITLPDMRSFFKGGRLRRRRERQETDALIRSYDIRPPDARRQFFQLSGGNQQKVVLAKWLRLSPQLIVFDEPVQGVDVGSKAQIYGRIEEAAAAGAGVLLIDSDFEDLARVCSRVIIMRHGRIVDTVSGTDLSRERILELVYLSAEASV